MRAVDEQAVRKEVVTARRMIEQGEYMQVIPRLHHTISKYPSAKNAAPARYYLGLAYYHIDGYRDAIDMFQEYLEMAPEGEFAEESRTYVDDLAQEYAQRYPSPERLDEQVASVKEQLASSPQSVDLHAKLADLLWKRGNYEESAAIYVDIVSQHPEFANDPQFQSRVELLPNNEYVVLSPSEVMRRQDEANPLKIINTNSFRSGRDSITQVPRYYAVTGQAVNQSESVLYGVEVHVTIYSFSNVVYDTTTYTIGRLNPGETRAFSVRMSNFDNIENIERYECVGTFER